MSLEVPRTSMYLVPYARFPKKAVFQEMGSLLDFFLLVSPLSQIEKCRK